MTLALDIAVGALAAVAVTQQLAAMADRWHARETSLRLELAALEHAEAEPVPPLPESLSHHPPVSRKTTAKPRQEGPERVFDPQARKPGPQVVNQFGQAVSRERAAELAAANSSGGTQ